jgi:hypothetical protein
VCGGKPETARRSGGGSGLIAWALAMASLARKVLLSMVISLLTCWQSNEVASLRNLANIDANRHPSKQAYEYYKDTTS